MAVYIATLSCGHKSRRALNVGVGALVRCPVLGCALVARSSIVKSIEQESDFAWEDLFAALPRCPPLTEQELADTTVASGWRSHDEAHDCSFCGDRAVECIIVGPSDVVGPARWLDSCAPHSRELRMAAIYSMPSDGELVRRFDAWRREAGIR